MRGGRLPAPLVHLWITTSIDPLPAFRLPRHHPRPGLRPHCRCWWHDCIQLLPVNPAFEPITLEPEGVSDLTIIGELVAQLTMPN